MLSVAVSFPAAFGVNFTVNSHFAPAATLLPHVSVSLKLVAFAPEIVALKSVNAVVPEFVNVTVFAELVVFSLCVPNVTVSDVKSTEDEDLKAMEPPSTGLPEEFLTTNSTAIVSPDP